MVAWVTLIDLALPSAALIVAIDKLAHIGPVVIEMMMV